MFMGNAVTIQYLHTVDKLQFKANNIIVID